VRGFVDFPERANRDVEQHVPWHASDQSRRSVTSSPSTKTWATRRSPCAKTGVHGRSAASAIRRFRAITLSSSGP